jgi:hypothetical protein
MAAGGQQQRAVTLSRHTARDAGTSRNRPTTTATRGASRPAWWSVRYASSDAPCHDRGEQPPSHEWRVDQRAAADNAASDLNRKRIGYSEQSAPPRNNMLHKQAHDLGPPPVADSSKEGRFGR